MLYYSVQFPKTGHPKWDGLNNKHFFLTIFKVGKFKI